jgi:hypothetical protein
MSRSRRSELERRRALVAVACACALLIVIGASADPASLSRGGAAARTAAHTDLIDPTTRLDLATASLEQVAGGELALQLTTHGPWDPADVAPSDTRGLCVWLRNVLAPKPGGRLCVVPDAHAKSKLHLRYTLLSERGEQLGIRELSSVVHRPGPTTVSARVEPELLPLVPGSYRWQVRSRSRLVEDRLPDRGELPLAVRAATAPQARERCFGAASRDPRRPCRNPRLDRVVVPTPDEALLTTNSPCAPIEPSGELRPCRFGVPEPDGRATIALLGDSHAAHWRAALEQVAQRKRWTGISITTSGCPLSRAAPLLEPESRVRKCARWNDEVPRWLARHREIRTLFVVQHAAAEVAVAPGETELETRAAGHGAAWRALPPSVRRVVVLRDTPLLGFQNACVQDELDRHGDAAQACAVPRDKALLPDAAVLAARRLRSPRLRVIDMTPFFCDRDSCPPVIGGALVYKDYEHISGVYATTLAPYLLRAIDAL